MQAIADLLTSCATGCGSTGLCTIATQHCPGQSACRRPVVLECRDANSSHSLAAFHRGVSSSGTITLATVLASG